MNDLSQCASEIQEKLLDSVSKREETNGVGETLVSGEHAVVKDRLQSISKCRAL